MRMVSRPTCGANLRFTASWAMSRTLHRALPSGGLTHQGDDPLALARIQHPPLAGTRFLIQRLLPSLLLAAPGNGPHGLGSHAYVPGHLRRCLSLVQLAQDRGSPQHPRGLPPLVQHPGDLLPILFPQLDMHPMIGLHVPTMRSIRSLHQCLDWYIYMWSET